MQFRSNLLLSLALFAVAAVALTNASLAEAGGFSVKGGKGAFQRNSGGHHRTQQRRDHHQVHKFGHHQAHKFGHQARHRIEHHKPVHHKPVHHRPIHHKPLPVAIKHYGAPNHYVAPKHYVTPKICPTPLHCAPVCPPKKVCIYHVLYKAPCHCHGVCGCDWACFHKCYSEATAQELAHALELRGYLAKVTHSYVLQ